MNKFPVVAWSARRRFQQEEELMRDPAGVLRRLTVYPRKAQSYTEIISGIKNLY
ncbi:hypothetical protein BACI349Y_390006 [Bacillus sp. 349Y]|nr:hypothetical protein BACI349Y_390006 [Bacillus sp. 349Y]